MPKVDRRHKPNKIIEEPINSCGFILITLSNKLLLATYTPQPKDAATFQNDVSGGSK